MSVAIILCLNIGVDPPDVVKVSLSHVRHVDSMYLRFYHRQYTHPHTPGRANVYPGYLGYSIVQRHMPPRKITPSSVV
eukprot:2308286-Pyramimonas_sp.AAC.1